MLIHIDPKWIVSVVFCIVGLIGIGLAAKLFSTINIEKAQNEHRVITGTVGVLFSVILIIFGLVGLGYRCYEMGIWQ